MATVMVMVMRPKEHARLPSTQSNYSNILKYIAFANAHAVVGEGRGAFKTSDFISCSIFFICFSILFLEISIKPIENQ